MKKFKRFTLVRVDFGEHKGTSIQEGVRPAIIISNDKANLYGPTLTVIPLTTKLESKKQIPTHCIVRTTMCEGLPEDSLALAEQLMTIDKTNVVEFLGMVKDRSLMARLTIASQIQIGVFARYNM